MQLTHKRVDYFFNFLLSFFLNFFKLILYIFHIQVVSQSFLLPISALCWQQYYTSILHSLVNFFVLDFGKVSGEGTLLINSRSFWFFLSLCV
jgi:hypothetical protein